MENAPERAPAEPPKCPSCKDVAMELKQVERNAITAGGTIHWVCHRCGLHLVRAFE